MSLKKLHTLFSTYNVSQSISDPNLIFKNALGSFVVEVCKSNRHFTRICINTIFIRTNDQNLMFFCHYANF